MSHSTLFTSSAQTSSDRLLDAVAACFSRSINHDLRMVVWNANSVKPKKSELANLLFVNNLDIAATSESKLALEDSQCLVIVCTTQIETNSVVQSCFQLSKIYVMNSFYFLMVLLLRLYRRLFVFAKFVSFITHPTSLFCTLVLILFFTRSKSLGEQFCYLSSNTLYILTLQQIFKKKSADSSQLL
jgi:hypothetical protein